MTEKKLEDYQKKEKSPVAGGAANNSNVAIAIIIIAAFALIYFTSGGEKEKKAEPQENFSTTTQTDTSFVQRKKTEEKEKKQRKESYMTEEEKALIQRALALQEEQKQQEQNAKKEALKKLEEAKRKSKMIVFSGSSSKSQVASKADSTKPGYLNNLLLQGDKPAASENPYDIPEPSLLDVTQVKQIPVLSRTLTAGKFISGILETAIDSTLPGDIRAIVSNDVYSEDGSNVLLEKGTRLIGRYKSGIQQGQSRVYVIWSTAITPSGLQVPLASTGTNALGVAGLSGDYDSHFMKRFGAALLLSVIENQNNNNDQLNVSTQNSLQNASSVALNHNINIPPTIYVDQGEKINIFVARNILF